MALDHDLQPLDVTRARLSKQLKVPFQPRESMVVEDASSTV